MRKTGILRFILSIMLLATLPMTMLAKHPISAASPVAGGYSTVVYARLFCDSTDVTGNANYEVNALMGGESRAVGTVQSLSDSSKILMFRVWGNVGMGDIDETGQPITFLMRDLATGKTYDVVPEEAITFRGDYTYGMPSAPIVLRYHEGESTPNVGGGYSTVVYAQLFYNGTDVTGDANYEVNALMGGESRAVGTPLALTDSSSVLVFRVWGDVGMGGIDETGQPITFLMHDLASGKDESVSPNIPITFRGDYTYGMPSAPIKLNYSTGPLSTIEELKAEKDHIYVYLDEGDIRERMDELITIVPADSKETFHWEVADAQTSGMITFDSIYINANNEGVAKMVAVADADPSIRSAAVTVNVINPARTLVVSNESLVVEKTSQEVLDVSEDLNGMIHVGPRGYSSVKLGYSSSDPTVVSTSYDNARKQQSFLAHKAGSAVVTTSLTYFNCYSETDTTITADITVYVSLPVTGVTADVNTLQVGRDSVAILTLKAVPEGAYLTSENINPTIADTRLAQLGDFEVEDGATSVEIPIEGLFPGSTSILNAIKPEGEAKAVAKIDVVVPLQLSEGWQWVTCYQPTAISGKDLEAAFGNRLLEVRSHSKTLFNDPDYGYIGTLYESGLGQNECYKIHMAEAASHVFELPNATVAPYAGGSLDIDGRWSWIANPYYCDHPIEGYLTGAMDEDMIVSQDGFAIFIDGHWDGSLEVLRHGEAYMYFAEYNYGTLHFKAEGYESDVVEEDEEENDNDNDNDNGNGNEDEEESKAFSPSNGHRFMDNMCVIATLDNNLLSIDNCQLGAFVGNECRGTARSKGGLFFLTVHGNAGEKVHLRLYDEVSDTYSDIEGTTELQPILGSIRKPLLIHKADNETLILDNKVPVQVDDSYYTLQGIQLRQTIQKGIYIHNGRKVVVR